MFSYLKILQLTYQQNDWNDVKMLRQMWESTVQQTLHVHLDSNTQRIQSFKWPKWCALWHYMNFCLVWDQTIQMLCIMMLHEFLPCVGPNNSNDVHYDITWISALCGTKQFKCSDRLVVNRSIVTMLTYLSVTGAGVWPTTWGPSCGADGRCRGGPSWWQ